MITLYHLNQSRSKRIIWLLEALKVDYQVDAYLRDKDTFLAPESLKKVHPLGKSPVIEWHGQKVAESGAIVQLLIDYYAPDELAPSRDSKEFVAYTQWLHFAESSAMVPLLLSLFANRESNETPVLDAYAKTELHKIAGYLNDSLSGKRYLIADKLTGADIMMSFVVEMLVKFGLTTHYSNIAQYAKLLFSHRGFEKAQALEAKYSV